MEEIEEGEFFPLNTDNRKESFKFLVKKLKKSSKPARDKGELIRKLNEEGIYKQKKDCKDFIKNCVKSRDHAITDVGRRKIALENKAKVIS